MPRVNGQPVNGASADPIEISGPTRFEARCSADVKVLDLVHVAGESEVRLCDPRDRSRMPAVGAVVAKLSETIAVVQVDGEIDGYVGLSSGRTHFVGADGRPAEVLEFRPE
jgi:hypothetical protein